MLRIIQLLQDGEFHSGEELGEKLSLTRSAIWKIVKQLSLWGVEVESRTGKGYRILGGLDLLNQNRIQTYIEKEYLEKIDVFDIFLDLSSTNDYLLQIKNNSIKLHSNCVCLAEKQTKGRGRLGRQWISPFARNIYLSVLWHFQKDMSELSGLSLIVAITLIKTLHKFGIHDHIGVKWPNDVLWKNQKLAGTLIEMTGEMHNMSKAVIGIGLNIQMPEKEAGKIDQPFTDMYKITQTLPDRNQLTGTLLNDLIQALVLFQSEGFVPFLSEWKKYDLTYLKSVSIHHPHFEFQGKSLGINETGQFLLKTEEGVIKSFSTGDVSLRLKSEAIN